MREYKTKLEIDRELFYLYDKKAISLGFHSFKRKMNCELYKFCFNKNMIIYKAIIPKGAIFFIGSNGDVVSNKLKIICQD